MQMFNCTPRLLWSRAKCFCSIYFTAPDTLERHNFGHYACVNPFHVFFFCFCLPSCITVGSP